MKSIVYWVNPHRIQYHFIPQPDIFEQFSISPGDWDTNIKRIDTCATFIGCKELFIEGKKWNDTLLFYNLINGIYEGHAPWSCMTWRDVDCREIKIRNLYQNIHIYGMLQQEKLPSQEIWNPDGNFIDEITVAVGRDGNLILVNGFHRYSIAIILNIKSIPVRILKVHQLWNEQVKNIKEICKNSWDTDKTYHPINHISFSDMIPIWPEKRADIIIRNINRKNKTVLDIGSLFGYMCTRLEDEGFKCTAVENYKQHIDVIETVKKAGYFQFEVFPKSIFEFHQFEFDIVLALNILHHFLKNEADFERLKTFLKQLKTNVIFLQIASFNEPQMTSAYIKMNDNQFVKFIMHCTGMNRGRLVNVEQNRKLFLLERKSYAAVKRPNSICHFRR